MHDHDPISHALELAAKPLYRASGGSAVDQLPPEAGFEFVHGLLDSAGHGRTDTLPINVPSGSYVLPADVVSGLGQGNTIAGAKVLDRVFSGMPWNGSGNPYGAQGGPRGARLADVHKGAGAPTPPTGAPASEATPPASMFGGTTTTTTSGPGGLKRGGQAPAARKRTMVPIIAAGGEYVVHPQYVEQLGDGDIAKGHDYLDKFVKHVRKLTHETLRKLPGPAKD